MSRNNYIEEDLTPKINCYVFCRSFIKRSLSDGNILLETNTPIVTKSLVQNQPLSEIEEGTRKGLSESTFNISACESNLSDERYGRLTFHTILISF